MLIDVNEVRRIFHDSLMAEQDTIETIEANGSMPGTTVVEGVVAKVAFDTARLESHRPEVVTLLRGLHIDFMKAGPGGGNSFLNACVDRDQELWTGFHRDVEMLMMLGLGLGLVGYNAPREMWPALPGSMPYFYTELPAEVPDAIAGT